MLLLLACNVDSGVQSLDEAKATFDSATGTWGMGEDSTVAESPCNGVDDDGDGEVDEGAGDVDEDGVSDCVDDACVLGTTPGGSVPVGDACTEGWVPADDPWDVVVEWSIPDVPSVRSLPVVGQLSDDDGDGDIDEDDIPDIVTMDVDLTLVVYSGDGSGERMRVPGATGPSPALVDVDHDGVLNIVYSGAHGLCAIDPDGTELWCATDSLLSSFSTVVVMDLEGDGNAEILAPGALLDAATGATIAEVCTQGFSDAWAEDLDGDGVSEIICGIEAWDAAGSLLWSVPSDVANGSAMVDDGLDGRLEVVLAQSSAVADGRLTLIDAETGVVRVSSVFDASGAPCVADFDGDGVAEIGQPGDATFDVYDLGLGLRWSVPTSEASGFASCSAYDFDGDGAYEIVYADTEALYIFDGATGAVNFSWSDHESATYMEYPAVVDVDGDGSVEIVVAQSGYTGRGVGLVVLGHGEGAWPPSDPLWSQASFDATLLDARGALYAVRPEPPVLGGFAHARPPGLYTDGGWSLAESRRHLSVQIDDVCSASCAGGEMDVSVSVANAGNLSTEATVALYTLDYTGELLLGSTTLTIDAGTRAEPMVFTIAASDVRSDGLEARVYATNGDVDCDAADNEDTFNDLPCL